MQRNLEFAQIDVFTEQAFCGNQLAVFLDARGLSTADMQTLAKEMNFAETTFVLPPEKPGNAARVRIFTTTREMPMAGHPTIGTALVLWERGVLTGDRAMLELNIGPIAITIDRGGEDDALPLVWMTQSAAKFGPVRADRGATATALGLTTDDLQGELPIQMVSTGVPYLLVPLRDRNALQRARLHQAALSGLFVGEKPMGVYLFADSADGLRARMFDPTEGLEDPATGSAAGPLACYALQRGLRSEGRFIIEQGVEMGRPSEIHVWPEAKGVLVGGRGVIVGRGDIYWNT